MNLDSFLHTRSIKEVRFPFLTSSSFFRCSNNFSLKRIEIIFFAITLQMYILSIDISKSLHENKFKIFLRNVLTRIYNSITFDLSIKRNDYDNSN